MSLHLPSVSIRKLWEWPTRECAVWAHGLGGVWSLLCEPRDWGLEWKSGLSPGIGVWWVVWVKGFGSVVCGVSQGGISVLCLAIKALSLSQSLGVGVGLGSELLSLCLSLVPDLWLWGLKSGEDSRVWILSLESWVWSLKLKVFSQLKLILL